MSKILDASANPAGQVLCEGFPVPSAQILSEGKQASTGILVLEGEKARYLTSSATDIKTSIEKLIAVLDSLSPSLTTIGNTLTAIGAGMLGPATAPPPTLATSVADIMAKVVALDAVKAELTTLKGALK